MVQLNSGNDGHDRLRGREGILEFFETAILLDVLFHHAAGDEVLKLFIRPETQHFFPAAHGIPQFQALIHRLEQTIEVVNLRLKKGSYEFISYMIGEASGEPGSFGGSHRSDSLAHLCNPATDFVNLS